MKAKPDTSTLFFIGDDIPQGCYVLRIVVRQHLKMPFGRFKRGKLVSVQSGAYIYTGSAMALRGSTCLANRLVRHATRTLDMPPHSIRAAMLREFPLCGAAADLAAPAGKTLRWHVDHLLDSPSVELASAYVIRSSRDLESEIADMLEDDSATTVFEKGLGARDRLGHTHLLQVHADDAWWDAIPHRILSNLPL